MLDIKFIREHPDLVKENIKRRKNPEYEILLDDVLVKDKQWRALKAKLDELRHASNKISEEINKAKKEGKEIKNLIEKAKELPKEIEALEKEKKEIEFALKRHLLKLPNLLHASVPEKNEVIRKFGQPKKIEIKKSHGEILEELDLADFKRSTKISGTGFYFLKSKLALLDLALQKFAIDFLIKNGYALTQVPIMMRREPYEGVVALEDFEKVMYKIEDEDLYLIATSEHPLIAQFVDEVISENKLPIRLCGLSPCFRKEIGSHGVDTRGIFRVHQFNKVEQAIVCAPEQSWDLHEELQSNAEKLFQALEIPYQVVNIGTEEIGATAAKKYDIEAWFPFQNRYAEVTSCSNCTDYQAIGLNIRIERKSGKREYAHTLNATAIATSRTMAAIVENFINPDGSIDIPKALVPYCGFDKIELEKNG